MRFTHRKIVRYMFAGVLLAKIADRKFSGFFPIGDQLGSRVGRAVVDDNPFEITQCLCPQAVIYAMKRVRPIIGGGEYGE